ncbi:methionyl-tRNA formyltransferase [Basilea psittacipulmonis]|uniref:Methionyl-tRNA formyltransferase n=1 Tax=Basilea psittacipulmonis DSM 24701 TaxID=1072685 RepID=A0A077DFA7_9BURK|nr:methionyl-tRNA formyltransferase [Basilea psittacipulmonis]AIL32087.1 methionyl-tRNA formyltransferase [Basilea psittacipulmonis DSM 24701]
MKVVFAGTPEFAKVAYQAILDAGFEVPLVMTQPDRPAGRGMKLTPSPVKSLALEHHAPVIQVQSLRLDGRYPDEAAQAKTMLEALQPDVMVVAAYGLILPKWVLSLPKYGCLNIHASLLPRWRGAAPIQRAIEAGDAETGVCIMQMNEGLDTGDVLLQRTLPIEYKNAAQLHDELAVLGGEMIVEVMKSIDEINAQPQPEVGITYAQKLTKQEAQLDWNESASTLERKIRAFNPVPGASVSLKGERIKVWASQVLDERANQHPIGEIIQVSEQGIDVQTAQGVLRLLELQKPGGKRQAVDVFVRGWH